MLIGVELEAQGTNLSVGKSRFLFGMRAMGTSTNMYPSPDGKRWLMVVPVEKPNASPVILTTNWVATLKQ
jgi:hypothetical protein